MMKLLAVVLLVCGCSSTAEQAVERLRFVHVKNSDLCFAITGTSSSEGGVAMVQVECGKVPSELLQTSSPPVDQR